MDTVYIETTVVGNIAGRLHPDAGIAARQMLTRVWWTTAPERYRLFISQLTLDECGDGDPDTAAERLDAIRGIAMLDTSDVAEDLARLLIDGLAVPASQPRDALHIATAAVHGVRFLATRNFEHILNPHLQTRIMDICRVSGFAPPVICTPQQLMETEDDS